MVSVFPFTGGDGGAAASCAMAACRPTASHNSPAPRMIRLSCIQRIDLPTFSMTPVAPPFNNDFVSSRIVEVVN
jgi:hypothetical protein